MPIPMPIESMPRPTYQYGLVWSIVPRIARPTTSRMPPAIRYRFHLPNRVIIWPDPTEPMNEPSIIGMVSRPASVGL